MATAHQIKLQPKPEPTVTNERSEGQSGDPANHFGYPNFAPSSSSLTCAGNENAKTNTPGDHPVTDTRTSNAEVPTVVDSLAPLAVDDSAASSATSGSESLPKEVIIELLRKQDGAKDELALLLWKDGTVQIVDRVDQDGRTLVPPTLADFGKPFNLRLPCGISSCPSSQELFDEICDAIRTYVEMPESSVYLVAAFCLSTWFVDKLAVAPYLWISGPPGSGKTTLLRLLHSLCRRAVLIGGISPRAYSLPALLQPTLLFDELKFNGTSQSQAFQCWLRAGNSRGGASHDGRTAWLTPFAPRCSVLVSRRQIRH